MKHMIVILYSALLSALLFSCSDQLAGNSSEITNGYCFASAAPADSAMVVAYPNNYIPYPPSAAPETTYTDKNGHFSIHLGHTGWNLVIYDKLQTRAAFVPLPHGDSAIDTITLANVGAVYGIVNDTIADDRCIGVVGTPFYTGISGKTDTFSLIKLPAFRYTIGIWRLKTGISDTNHMEGSPIVNNNLNGGSAIVWVVPDSTTNIIITP